MRFFFNHLNSSVGKGHCATNHQQHKSIGVLKPGAPWPKKWGNEMTTLDIKDIEKPGELTHSVFRLFGTTKVRVKEVKDLDGKQGIAIPTQSLKIAPIEAISEALRSSIAVATEQHRDKFSLTSYIFSSDDRFCYPVVDVKSAAPVDVGLTRSVIFKLLEQIKRCDEHTMRLFSGDHADLSEQANAEIKAGATEILTRYGDSPISTPSQIYIGGNSISAELKGMFANKPDLSNLEPVLLEIEGQVDGYRAKKREIYLNTSDGLLLVNWEHDDQVVGNLSLSQKADLLICKISRTIDQRGNPINTLVNISKK